MKIENWKLKINAGFTLIELLVVIAIIGILASLALVSYGGAQKQGRDTKRKSDLAQYRNALEAYAGQNNGLYPGLALDTVYQIAATNLCAASTLLPYMSDTCLADPVPSGSCTVSPYRQYCYFESGTVAAGSIDYLLYGALETGGFWEVCSNGKAGKVASLPGDVSCDVTP